MLLLDAVLRFSAVTLLLFTAVLALRDARALLQARLAAALCLSLSAMLINTLPAFYAAPFWVEALAWFLHIPNVALLWVFGLSLFEDDFRLTGLHWGVGVAMFVLLILMYLAEISGAELVLYAGSAVNRALGVGIILHLMWTALSGRENDLVETRRRTRLWFTLGVAVTALLILGGESVQFAYTLEPKDPPLMSTIRVAVALPMIAFGALWFAGSQPENFRFEVARRAEPEPLQIGAKDGVSYAKLDEAMQAEIYLEPGLTITALADRISVPEHQLRAIINKGLGFRNFSAFLNSYRIAYAKDILANPAHARVPVLTVAMDAGFNSLAPFNRAFRLVEGATPTAYRQQMLGGALSDVEKV